MTLAEGFAKDQVFIDFDAEIMYGDDQCYIDYPCRFPTVGDQRSDRDRGPYPQGSGLPPDAPAGRIYG